MSSAVTIRRLSLSLVLSLFISLTSAAFRRYDWVLTQTKITKLCKSLDVVTVNGKFPGPTIRVRDGDDVVVNVHNAAKYNATLHWHGVRQMRNPWADGPAFVTQCPIRPGQNFTYRFKIEDQQGTLFWHAHSSWLRATVHGAIVILPRKAQNYPCAHPGRDEILVLGEWWDADPVKIEEAFIFDGGKPKLSDSLTINGNPGHLASCPEMSRIKVTKGETILFRIINAAMAYTMFLRFNNHTATLVAVDAQYIKPFQTDLIIVGPGETADALITFDKGPCGNSFFLAARAYWASEMVPFDETTTTATIDYICNSFPSVDGVPDDLPDLPAVSDTDTVERFYRALRSLRLAPYVSSVPDGAPNENLFFIENPGMIPCNDPNITCMGPNDERIVAGMNNVSFLEPTSLSILEAYFFNVSGVYSPDFPDRPQEVFDFTNTTLAVTYSVKATKVKVLRFNSTVQLVIQSVGILGGENHNFHLHGHDFFIVGRGFGNYDPVNDPKTFNLADPPRRNTLNLPFNGWAAIRFLADNPGLWFFHCHVDYHMSIGMSMVFLTLDGVRPQDKMLPPPPDFRRCALSDSTVIQRQPTGDHGDSSVW